jgi:hypothetical protein
MTFLLAAGGAALGYAGVGGLTMATGGMLGLGLGSALGTSKAAGQAAQTQADAATQAAAVQAQSSDKALALQEKLYREQVALQEPYRQAGLTGQNKLMEMLGLGGNIAAPGYGKYAKDFSMADYKADPGYAFRLSEGMKQLSAGARAGGGAVSGRTMMGAENYAQGLASQEYGNAFQRYQAERENRLRSLGSLMSSGQAAASNQAGAAGSYGTSGSNLMTGAGNAIAGGITGAGAASAAGTLGAANTLANTLGATASAYQNQSNFNNWLAQNKIPAVSQPTYMTPQNMNFDPYSGVRQSTTGYI